MHQMVPAIYYLFWVRYHPGRVYSQKKPLVETKYRPLFPHHQPIPSKFLNYGPTSLVLVGYRLVVLRPLCACSTIFYFCLLSFPHHFHCSRLVLFHLAACLFYLCLSFVQKDMGFWACLVLFCLFFDFVFFLIHAFPATVFVLFLYAFLATFVISFGSTFLFFMQFLLLTLSTVPCFFSSYFFILVFTPILLYKRI